MTRQIVEPLAVGMHRLWDVSDVIFEETTPYQRLLIGNTAHGVTLFCDDERQSATRTERYYHEALMVPPLLLAERLDRVLIVGSSEGVASQLAVAAGATIVDHVDIDRTAVHACADHLPYGYDRAELANVEAGTGQVRLHYQDGWRFLAEAQANDQRYDVVVIDLPDENDDESAQHNRLYGTEFLRRCASVLAAGGVVTAQAGCPTMWRDDTLRAAWRRFTEVFATTAYYGSVEHEWAFLTGTTSPVSDPVETIVDRLPQRYQPRTIDADTLRASMNPPRALRIYES